jgi:GT2 family glycosyltransferase
LIIVDDNSNENIKIFLEKIIQNNPLGNIQRITYIKNQENKGFPHNANIILDEASYEMICILNSDTYVCENALEKIIKILQENENVLVAGPSTSNANSPQMFLKYWLKRFTTEKEIKSF